MSRPNLRYARTVGSFSNVVALRASLDGDPIVTDFLQRQHERLAQGLSHQDYPFPLLVEKLRPVRRVMVAMVASPKNYAVALSRFGSSHFRKWTKVRVSATLVTASL